MLLLSLRVISYKNNSITQASTAAMLLILLLTPLLHCKVPALLLPAMICFIVLYFTLTTCTICSKHSDILHFVDIHCFMCFVSCHNKQQFSL